MTCFVVIRHPRLLQRQFRLIPQRIRTPNRHAARPLVTQRRLIERNKLSRKISDRAGEGSAILSVAEMLHAMRDAVLALLQDDSRRERIAHAARERVRALAWERQVRGLEAIYRSWLVPCT